MKKILLLTIVFFIATLCLTSCSGQKDSPSSSHNVLETENQDTTSPFKLPQITIREWVVDYMYKMANVKWTPSQDMDLTHDDGGHLVGETLYFKKGVVYHGIPYISLDTASDLQDFLDVLTPTEGSDVFLYDCPPDRKGEKVKGNQCSAAPLHAWRRFDPDVKAEGTNSCFLLGEISGVYPVGNMVVGEYDRSTKKITNNTDENTHYEAFALLQKGDMILYYTSSGHMRMVVDVHVERTPAGKIDRRKSYVKTIEQTNTMDSSRTDGVKTTWFVDHIYTFAELRERQYIPITCKALSQPLPEHRIEVKNANTYKTIMNTEKLTGTVESVYPIIGMGIYIKDLKGKIFYEEFINVHLYDISSVFEMKNFKFGFDFNTLPPGDYAYTVEAETVCGKGEIYRADFTK